MTEREWTECFKEKLIELMRERGMTQKELAKKAYITEETLSRCLNGKHFPSVMTFNNLARALNVTCDELGFFGEGVH